VNDLVAIVIWNYCAAAAARLILDTIGSGLAKRNAGKSSRTAKVLLVFKQMGLGPMVIGPQTIEGDCRNW